MNEIVKSFEGNDIRIVEREDGIWFAAKDVCAYFGEKNYRRAMGSLDPDEKGVSQMNTPGGRQNLTVVNESGLYGLLFAMQPQKARGVSEEYIHERQEKLRLFKRWVTHEVLPSIRKTGAYVAPNIGLEQLAAVAKKIGEMAQRLIAENAELREKIEYMAQFIPDDDEFGKPSKINGKPKWRQRRGCYVSVNGSKPKRLNPDTNGYLQLDLFRDFIPAMLIADAVNIINIHCPKLLEGTANV